MSTVGNYRGPSIVKDGLVLYLDAATANSYNRYVSPTTFKDISGNGNNGTLTNGPVYNGGNGGSIVLDGTNQYVSIPSNSVTKPNTLTASCWVNWTQFGQSSAGYPIIGNSNGSLQGFVIYQATSSPYNGIRGRIVTTSNSNVIDSSKNLSLNQWYYLTLSYDTANMYLYINETLINSASLTGNINYASSVFQIGTAGTGTYNYFKGKVSNAQLYNRALSATEVLQNYNATRARFGV